MTTKSPLSNKRGAKVTPALVRELRRAIASGALNQREAAQAYGLSGVQVGRIWRRESWGDVEDEAPQDEVASRLLAEQSGLGRLQQEELLLQRGQTIADQLKEGLDDYNDEGE